jgi:hypothetical protein
MIVAYFKVLCWECIMRVRKTTKKLEQPGTARDSNRVPLEYKCYRYTVLLDSVCCHDMMIISETTKISYPRVVTGE